VVMKCLEKRPEDRFADVGALALALAPFAPQAAISVERITRTLSARPKGPVTTPQPGASQTVASSLAGKVLSTPGAWRQHTSPGNKRHRLPKPLSWMPVWAAAALVIAALLGGVALALSRGPWTHPAPPVSAAAIPKSNPSPSAPESSAAPETPSIAEMTREPEPPASVASERPRAASPVPLPSARTSTPRPVAPDNPPPSTTATGSRRNPLAVELK
jgi:hypothetical protein